MKAHAILWLLCGALPVALSGCELPVCGNQKKESGEDCDYGKKLDNRCSETCTWRRCGDGVLDAPALTIDTDHDGLGDVAEVCDPGVDGGPACRQDCRGVPGCGNGLVEAPETCDRGAKNSDTEPGGCRLNCQRAACGDGVIDTDEVCDDSNTADGDGCDSNCRPTGCGNGVVTAGEVCDEGEANSDLSPGSCRNNCTPMICGDGIRDPGEACDDANTTSGDGCDANCKPTGCGNGLVTAGETCDDGNDFNTDSCLPSCQPNDCLNGLGTDGQPCFVLRRLPTQGEPRAVLIADVDGDTWPEIIVADREKDAVRIWWNANGSFTQQEIWVAPYWTLFGDRPVDVAVGDVNADGRNDLVTANEMGDRVCILENTTGRSFNKHFYELGNFSTEVELANFDGAAGLELAVALNNDSQIRIWKLDGTGFARLTPIKTISTLIPVSLSVGDFGGDGDPDLVWSAAVYKDVVALPTLAVNSSGTFSVSSVQDGEPQSLTVRLWDLGLNRAVVVAGVYGATLQPHLRLFNNPYVDVPTAKWPVHLAYAGGRAVYADNGGAFAVFQAQNGSLVNERVFTWAGDATGVAAGDVDKDGSIDVAISSPEAKAVLLFLGRP